jgi:signal transduction histidine kinase
VRIALFTKDKTLLPLCQDIVTKLPVESCEVVLADPDETVEADVYLWDLDAKPRTPFLEGRPSIADVFLVRRSALKAFLDRFPQAGAATLLKPVSSAALEVFLSHFASRLNGSNAAPENVTQPQALDRDALLDCLLHSTFRLQEFEEDRTNFWARAAHDLRAPLTAASGYCGLLIENQFGPINNEQRELLERIQHSLKKLNRMASAMFQLTAGRQLDRKYELKRTEIEPCIQRSIDEIRFFALEKHLALDVEISDPGQHLYMEPTQIEQVLINLLENACKFTPRNGFIKVRGYPVHRSAPSTPVAVRRGGEAGPAGKAATGYRVDVQDSGPGIPPEHLPNIFEEYVSYDPADRSGGGLGLAICKMILRAHRGEIWAEAAADKGAIFSFVLPFHQQAVEHSFEPVAAYAGCSS